MIAGLEPIERIKRRFELNTGRIVSLITIYNNIGSDGISSSQKKDILRSAVVFIHATLEDLLRELIRWKAPIENGDFVSSLRFQLGEGESKQKANITISELISLKPITIDKIVKQAIDKHLDKRTYSDETRIKQAIDLLSLPNQAYRDLLAPISSCVIRRHNIVHRGDRKEHSDTSHGTPKRIEVEEVIGWNNAVQKLGEMLFEHLEHSRSNTAGAPGNAGARSAKRRRASGA